MPIGCRATRGPITNGVSRSADHAPRRPPCIPVAPAEELPTSRLADMTGSSATIARPHARRHCLRVKPAVTACSLWRGLACPSASVEPNTRPSRRRYMGTWNARLPSPLASIDPQGRPPSDMNGGPLRGSGNLFLWVGPATSSGGTRLRLAADRTWVSCPQRSGLDRTGTGCADQKPARRANRDADEHAR